MKRKLPVLTLLLLLSFTLLKAQSIYRSLGTGVTVDLGLAANWQTSPDGGTSWITAATAPTGLVSGSTILIQSADTWANANTATIPTGVTLTNNSTLLGTFTAAKLTCAGTLICSGTAAQTLPASASFVSSTVANLTVNNTLGVSSNGTISITGVVNVIAGQFNCNNGGGSFNYKGSITGTGGFLNVAGNFFTQGSAGQVIPSVLLLNNTINKLNVSTSTSGLNNFSSTGPIKISSGIGLYAGIFTLGGALTVTGTTITAAAGAGGITAGNNMVTFNATTAQTIPIGFFTNNGVNNLTLNNALGVSSAGSLSINNSLTITGLSATTPLTVTGTAGLSGDLTIGSFSGTPTNGQQYTLISGTAISGAFTGNLTLPVGYIGTLSYTSTTVKLTVTRNVVYYSKSTGDLSTLATYGTATDGTGTAPSDFNTTNATYQLANRSSYSLTADLVIGTTLGIPAASTLDIAGNTLTVNALSGNGTLTGSNTSSFVVNGIISSLSFATGKEQLSKLTLGSAANVNLTSLLNIASTGSVILGASATLNTGGLLTLKSDVSGTAQIPALATGAAISGNVTVERYLFDKRAWRLISSPVNSNQTINAAWQEGAIGAASDPNPGYGTFMIGNSTANGFDIVSTSGSLLVYNGSTFSNAANTNSITVSSNPGYFLFSIGNRSVNSTTAGAHSSTILRSTGSLRTGSQSAPVTASGYTLVANPYAAPVDFSQVARSSSVPNQFYTWDMGLGTYGGYVLVTNTGGSNYTSVPASPSGITNIIASGAAIFVQADGTNAGTLTFNETSKAGAAGSGTFSNFSTSVVKNTLHDIRVNLADAGSNLIDGVMASYAVGNSNNVDAGDALKMPNFYENISLNRSGKQLTMERRADMTSKDTIFIQLSGVKNTNYQLQINPADLNEPGMTAYLEDAYLHTRSSLDLSQVSSVPFTVNSDTTSYKGRFQISFAPETGKADDVTKIAHIGARVIAYPNPIIQKQVNLSFDGMPAGNYNITVLNTFGQVMQKNSMDYNGGASNKSLVTDYSTGVYTINIKSSGYNQSIKVIIP